MLTMSPSHVDLNLGSGFKIWRLHHMVLECSQVLRHVCACARVCVCVCECEKTIHCLLD